MTHATEKTDLQLHVESIANNLTSPPWDEWNEGRDIDNEGEFSNPQGKFRNF